MNSWREERHGNGVSCSDAVRLVLVAWDGVARHLDSQSLLFLESASFFASIYLDEEVVNYGDDQRPVACSSSSIADLTVVLFPAALDTMSQSRQ